VADEPEKVWHVGIRGERKGPFTADEVKDMIDRGDVSGRDVAWKEGMDDWLPAEQLDEFAEAVKSAPPPPPAPGGSGENPFALYFGNFWKSLRGILRDPDSGLATAADNKDLCLNVSWLVAGILVFALLCLQYSAGAFRLGPGLSGRGAMFLKGLLHAVIIYVIWFGVLLVTLVPILKSQATWQDVLTILGLSTIPTACIGLVAFALIWIHGFFAVLLYLAAVGQVVFYFRLFCHAGRVSARAAIYAVPATYFAALLVYNLLRLAMT